MTDDLFADAITDPAELREVYAEPAGLGKAKEIDTVDEMARRLIALAPLVFVASTDAGGRCDVSPRGGPPADYAALVTRERKRWFDVVRQGNVQAD